MTELTIRDATPGDQAAWHALWAQYLDFYAHPLAPAITAQTWARILDPAAPMGMRVACRHGVMLGFAIHLHHPSSWVMGDDGYLEDLFVTATARGLGVGRALIDDLVTLGRARGWQRLYWHTQATNATARRLYDSYVQEDGHIRYRMTL